MFAIVRNEGAAKVEVFAALVGLSVSMSSYLEQAVVTVLALAYNVPWLVNHPEKWEGDNSGTDHLFDLDSFGASFVIKII